MLAHEWLMRILEKWYMMVILELVARQSIPRARPGLEKLNDRMALSVSYLKSITRRTVGERSYVALSSLRARVNHWQRLATGADPWIRPDVRIRVENHGGWCLWPASLSRTSVVYSFGIGHDVAFDLSVIETFGADVHAFDPTPSALEWVRRQSMPPAFHVQEYGIASFDGIATFGPPTDPVNPSFSYRGSESPPSGAVTGTVRRLSTIMRSLGHDHVDLLKLDIEGAEYEVIDDLLAQQLDVRQLLVEFHHRKPWIGVEKTRTAVGALRGAGFELFHISPIGQEFSFRRPRDA
jgi:FkbM family methyltransferase